MFSRRIIEIDPEAKVIMITAFHDMETTIEAMRQAPTITFTSLLTWMSLKMPSSRVYE